MPEEQIQKLENKQEYVIKRDKVNVINNDITKNFDEALAKYSHLRSYINDISRKIGLPEWMTSLDFSLKSREEFNILYPVGDPIFIHIYKLSSGESYYNVIEPELTKDEKEKLEKIQTKIVKYAVENINLNNIEEVKKTVIDLFNRVVEVGRRSLFSDKVFIKNKEEYDRLLYFLIRERFGYGFLEPFLRDPYLEDVHILGMGPIYVVHKIFGMLQTNRKFEDEKDLNRYIIRYSEIVDRPVSETRPIVDAILPDGSRVNFIYGKDISLHGSSFTIRKFSAKPLSITQLISFGTISPEEAAYLWLAIENGMNIVVSGETASGKTTLLNALTTFIRPDAKVYSVEDTPELNIPHPIWQRLVTREVGKAADVSMYDLLRAALRSRPNYILIGEIRGKEGYVAFQAMQCVKDAKVVLGDEVKNIKDLFEEYKNKYGVKIIDGKEVVEIKDNFEIPSYNGKEITKAKVKAILKMPKSKLIRVILEDGNVFEVTPNHKFITNYGELSAEELYEAYKKNLNIYVKRVNNFEKKEENGIKFKEEKLELSNPWFWYGLGRLLGDDSIFIYYKNDKIKGFIWQAKTTHKDEAKWMEIMDKVLPNNSKSKIKTEGNTYIKRIYLKWWFVDWLIKNGFIEIPEKKNEYASAVIKHVGNIPKEALGPFLAGMFDSDGSILWVNKKTMLFRFALDLNRKNREDYPLAIEQIKLFKKLKGKLPKILEVVFRYSSEYEDLVKRYKEEIEKNGVKVKMKRYDKRRGIYGYVIFSTKREKLRWFAENVVPYMLREDKKENILRKINVEIKRKDKLNINDYEVKYIEVKDKDVDKMIEKLWLSGYDFSLDSIFNRKRIIYLDNREYVKVIKVEEAGEDYTYDILLEGGGKYYVGFNGGGAIAIEDTGHPVMTTFHSGNIASLIERMTGEPINIPITFIDNLNIAVFTSTVTVKGRMERRITSIYEIERYIAELKKVAVRRVFSWDSVRDKHMFSGKYNSYILERKIAPLMKIDDKRKMYEILDYRARILKRMVDEQIFDFFEVWEILKNFYINGPSALPFSV
ncbi:hypothetical protein YN1_5660 [Nanoarchaeota archaeon]